MNALDYADNIIQLLASFAGILICLFNYISHKRKAWLIAGCFFAGNLLSSYFWTILILLEGSQAPASDIQMYIGWNIAFMCLAILLVYMKSREERRFFHPLMLLVLPLNIWQLTLYLPYGVVNSVYQVTAMTAIELLSIQSLLWRRKNGGIKSDSFYIAVPSLLYSLSEFGMWTSTCFYEPVASLYYPFTYLASIMCLALAVALMQTYKSDDDGYRSKTGLKNMMSTLLPMILIFCMMIAMVIYTSKNLRDVSVANLQEVGEDRITGIAAQLENYLERTRGNLWLAADTVDHMLRNGATVDEVLDYITEETNNLIRFFDENYTGIYGYIDGTYIDGSGWVPPEGYDPVKRSWYQAGIKAGGETIIVSPYLDAQTGGIVISICRRLSTGRDVLSLDVTMNHIQEITSDLHLKGKGYGFVVNEEGMIIAHREESEKGKMLGEFESGSELMDKIKEVKNGYFEFNDNGEPSTAFVQMILDQWYVVIVVSNRDLYETVNRQLSVNILACAIIFMLIVFVYMISQKREYDYTRRIEEMTAEEQRQAYESKLLKIEKDAADKANQAKSDFLADMSHEIRTPINAVLGMNEMVIRESEYAQNYDDSGIGEMKQSFSNISRYAGNIERAGKNLLSIINDILDFSKIEAGKTVIVNAEYSMSSVLNDVSNMIFFKAKEKDLDFNVDVDESVPDRLFGDETRVRQVILNLLNNAVKYTNEGEVSLSVRYKAAPCPADALAPAAGADTSGSASKTSALAAGADISGAASKTSAPAAGDEICLIISVKDTGIGIRDEDKDRLFSKFERVDLDRNSTVEGTGLGLAIAQSLLKMMGGSVTLESEYGKGSEFTIFIPQKVMASDPIGDFRSRFESIVRSEHNYREKLKAPDAHILVVDDTPVNITVVNGLLRTTGVKITSAGGGEEAVGLAQSNAYDLILMDQRMPKMDGTEALNRIRAQQDGMNRETPVICLTADAVIGAKERYIREGFTDYLTKPVEGTALEKMLIKYLPADKVTIIRSEKPKVQSTETGANGTAGSGALEAAGAGALEAAGAGVTEASGSANTENQVATDAAGAGFATDAVYQELRKAGIDPETGTSYCGGDRELYSSLLSDYLRGSKEKSEDIQNYFDNKDWKNYSILVHSVKSSSKMLGAAGLSELAAQLEAAADSGDIETVSGNHSAMLAMYSEVCEAVRRELRENGALPGSEAAAGEPEILEFFPES